MLLFLSLVKIKELYFDISSCSGNSLASRKKLLPIVKDFLKERDRDGCLGDSRLGDMEEEEEESGVPPTPMNSLVDGCPLDDGLPRISAQDLEDKFSEMADRGAK